MADGMADGMADTNMTELWDQSERYKTLGSIDDRLVGMTQQLMRIESELKTDGNKEHDWLHTNIARLIGFVGESHEVIRGVFLELEASGGILRRGRRRGLAGVGEDGT